MIIFRKIAMLMLLVLGQQCVQAATTSCTTLMSVGTHLIDFGQVVPGDADKDAIGTFTFNCTTTGLPAVGDATEGYRISINQGTAPTANFYPRQLKFSGSTMGYNLYVSATDRNNNTVWGDGTSGTVKNSALFLTCPAGICTTLVYGRLFLSTATGAPAGNYIDTVQVTIDYDI